MNTCNTLNKYNTHKIMHMYDISHYNTLVIHYFEGVIL